MRLGFIQSGIVTCFLFPCVSRISHTNSSADLRLEKVELNSACLHRRSWEQKEVILPSYTGMCVLQMYMGLSV